MAMSLELERRMNNLSIIHPFYNDEERLALQFENWMTWDPSSIDKVDITLIDDCSTKPLIIGPKRTACLKEKGLTVRIYRITDSLKWNTPGSLNLGFTVAPQEWSMTMDSDCFLDSDNLKKLLTFQPPSLQKVYKFNRQRLGDSSKGENLENTRPLTCTMLMHKSKFWDLNGFDEDFTGANSGGYGFFDNDFDKRLSKRNIYIVRDVIVGEWMPSVCGECVQRDHGEDHRVNKRLMYAKEQGRTDSQGGVDQNKQLLNFSWEKIYDSKT